MSVLRGRPSSLVRDEAGFTFLGVLVVMAIVLIAAIIFDQTRASTPGPTLATRRQLDTQEQQPTRILDPGSARNGGGLAPVTERNPLVPAEPTQAPQNCLAGDDTDDTDSDAGVTHGAGSNAPYYTDCGVSWIPECLDEDNDGASELMKITQATIHMWAKDSSFDVMRFRYRPVPRGSVYESNMPWSEWAEATLAPERFENEPRVVPVTAGEHGEEFSIDAEWDLQVELEFGKERALDDHNLYSYPIVTSCTVNFGI